MSVLANLTIGCEQKNLCLLSHVLSPFIWRGRLICIFHKKGARKIGPLFYRYVPTLFAVAHEL